MKLQLFILLIIGICFSQSFINTSTVNITLSRNYTTTEMTQYYDVFFDDYGSYILGILCLGLSYLYSPNNLSQVFTLTGAGFIFIAFIMGTPIFYLGAVFMLVLGAIVKHMVG